MRNKCKIKVILIILGIVAAFLSINNYTFFNEQDGIIEIREEGNLKSPKISGYWPNCPPIHINNDNWSATDLDWIQNNTGTYNDPHIIENVTINAGNIGSCILIENSNEYFIIRNCTLFNSGNSYPDGGITLMNANNSEIFNNTCSFNNYYGIVLDQCFNSTIHENIASNNTIGGIGVAFSYDIKILKNNAHYNYHYGLQLYSNHDFLIEKNIFNYNKEDGINSLWVNSSNVVNNTLRYNTAGGINWNAAYYNNISRNLIANNEHSGFSSYNFRTGFILENDIYENGGMGLYLVSPDPQKINENSTIQGNRIIGNIEGLVISSYHNNTIQDNIVTYNEKNGMIINGQFNRISNNMVSYNYESGISIIRRNNVIFKNTILFNHQNGIYSWYNSHLNSISNNTINYNNEYGIKLVKSTNNSIDLNRINHNYGGLFMESSNYNNISQNSINHNYQEGIYLLHSNYTTVSQNQLFGNEICILEFECEYNQFEDNECSVTSTDIFIDILDQSFSTESFNFTFLIYNGIGQGIDSATILMWWDGNDISTGVQNLGNGYYFVSLEAITVESDEQPILFNMTISASGYKDKYFETYIAIHPSDLVDYILELDLVDQSFSTEEFNMTYLIHNKTGNGIDFATIQVWWNGADISDSVVNLGNGLYFISLEPITVAPGEDPILLKMIISASGYEDKQFETYLAVDPETLEKEAEKGAEVVTPIIILIAIISTVAGIGVATISIALLRRKKRTSEVV